MGSKLVRPRHFARLATLALVVAAIAPVAAGADGHSNAGNGHGERDCTPFRGVHFVGRFDFREADAPRCQWTYCGIEFDFTGTGFDLDLSGAGRVPFAISVDGERIAELTTNGDVWTTTDAISRYHAVSGLRPGRHSVSIHRLPEAMFGPVAFHDVRIHHGQVVGRAPRQRHNLEIIGDSISAGYGTLSCDFDTEMEDGALTYGAVTARRLGAEARIEAFSGIGMVLNLDGSTTWTMPDEWSAAYLDDDSVPYDCSEWTADAVVINLGTNDFNAGVEPSAYVDRYHAFIEQLRDCYPDALILCAINDQNDKFSSAIDELLSETSDSRVEKIDLRTPNWNGCDGHPDLVAHEAMAATLVTRLSSEWRR